MSPEGSPEQKIEVTLGFFTILPETYQPVSRLMPFS